MLQLGLVVVAEAQHREAHELAAGVAAQHLAAQGLVVAEAEGLGSYCVLLQAVLPEMVVAEVEPEARDDSSP